MADQNVETRLMMLNQAYDQVTFPGRQRQARINAVRQRRGRLAPFTAHLLDRVLPSDVQNPNRGCNARNRRRTTRRSQPL